MDQVAEPDIRARFAGTTCDLIAIRLGDDIQMLRCESLLSPAQLPSEAPPPPPLEDAAEAGVDAQLPSESPPLPPPGDASEAPPLQSPEDAPEVAVEAAELEDAPPGQMDLPPHVTYSKRGKGAFIIDVTRMGVKQRYGFRECGGRAGALARAEEWLNSLFEFESKHSTHGFNDLRKLCGEAGLSKKGSKQELGVCFCCCGPPPRAHPALSVGRNKQMAL